jgi:hypothetical protein
MAKIKRQKNNSMMFVLMIATLATSQKWKTKNTMDAAFFSGDLIFTILRKEFSKTILSQIPFLKTKIAKKKKPNDKKEGQNRHNYLQYERVLSI